ENFLLAQATLTQSVEAVSNCFDDRILHTYYQQFFENLEGAQMSKSPANTPAQYANVAQIKNYAEYIGLGPGPIADTSVPLIFTIAGWFRFPTGFRKGFLFNKSPNFCVTFRGDNLYAHLYPPNQEPGIQGSTVIQPGIWYHIALAYDGDTLSLYVNGGLDVSGSTTWNSPGPLPLTVAGGNFNATYADV